MSNMEHFLSTFENVTFDEKKHIELMGETLHFDVTFDEKKHTRYFRKGFRKS